MKARAFLGNNQVSAVMNVLPYTAQWQYGVNSQSTDTLGGRVVQVLSVDIDALNITSVAVSRSELQRLAKEFKNIMNFHIQTQDPVSFRVPSMKWDMLVYLEAVPQLGWDVKTVTYPYQLSLRIVDDISLTKTNQLLTNQLNRLAEGIGYNPNVHGGDALAFSDLVNSLNLSGFGSSTNTDSGTSGSGTGGGGTGGSTDPSGGTGSSGGTQQYQGSSVFPPGIANLAWQGATLRDKVANMLSQFANRNPVFEPADVQKGLCTIQWESGWDPNSTNRNNNGSIDRGLWQINSIHTTARWWPSDVNLLFNPEYNTRCALEIWTAAGSYSPWYGYRNHCT